MAWWISFTLIHTKAVYLNQSKKGSCMNQSQNAIFTSPTGEENLMNSNPRDSESITGESNLINVEVLFAYRIKYKCLNSVYKIAMMKSGLPFQPPQRSLQRPTKLISLSFSLLSHYQNLPCVQFLVCIWLPVLFESLVSKNCVKLVSLSPQGKVRVVYICNTLQAPDNSTWHIRGTQNIQGIQTKEKTYKPSFARLNFGSKTHWFIKPDLCSYF